MNNDLEAIEGFPTHRRRVLSSISWATPEQVWITHSSGHIVCAEVRSRGRIYAAKATAMAMLKGKLWSAPNGPDEIPMNEVRVYDHSHQDQAYWNCGGSCEIMDAAALELEDRLSTAVRILATKR